MIHFASLWMLLYFETRFHSSLGCCQTLQSSCLSFPRAVSHNILLGIVFKEKSFWALCSDSPLSSVWYKVFWCLESAELPQLLLCRTHSGQFTMSYNFSSSELTLSYDFLEPSMHCTSLHPSPKVWKMWDWWHWLERRWAECYSNLSTKQRGRRLPSIR